MKYFALILFSFFLFTGTINVSIPIAHATAPSTQTSSQTKKVTNKVAEKKKLTNKVAEKKKIGDKPTKKKKKGDNPTNPTNPSNVDKVNEGYGFLMTKIMSLFAWLLGVAALLLDYSVYYTVVHMGTITNNLSTVGTTWRVLRDIGNIILIFGFLAIGITTILQVNWYGGGKKMIPILLVAAVFLNFSLFISEAVIDTGNLFATQFYTQINGGQPASAAITSNSIQNEGISNKIMSQLGLATIYGEAQNNTFSLSASSSWFTGFMGIILFLVAAMVMFSLAIILIIRFVILIFLIIVAPIGFAGLAVPKLASVANSWWSELFKQTIIAPILLLMLYIALRVITDVNFLSSFGVKDSATAAAAWSGTLTGNSTNFSGILLSFLVAMGLLLAVTYFAKRLGATGANWATSMGSKLSFGLTAASTSYMMRHTIGRGANRARNYVKKTSFGQSEMGRHLSGALNYGAKASYDFRGPKIASKGLRAAGIDAGTATKGGFKGSLEKGVKARVDYGNSLKRSKKQEEALKSAEAQKEEHKENYQRTKSGLESEHEAQLKSHNEGIEKQKERISTLEKLRDKQHPFFSEESLNEAKTALKKENKSREDLQNIQKEAIKELNESYKKGKKDIQGIIESRKRAPQEKYVKSLHGFLSSFARSSGEAAHKIIKNEVKKGLSDEDLGKIAKLFKETDEQKT